MKLGLIILIAILSLVGCSTDAVAPASTAPAPTPIPEYSIVGHDTLMEVYSNGLPDYSYYPLELRGIDQGITEWIRPVIPAKIDIKNRIIATSLISRGVGFLCESEGRQLVVSSSGPFQVALLSEEDKAAGLTLGAVLAWDIVPGLSEGGIIQPNEVLKIVEDKNGEPYIDEHNGLILLERINPEGLPRAEDMCPFSIDAKGLKPGYKLVIVGHSKGDAPELLLPYQFADLTATNRQTGVFYFTGSTFLYDWGSPIFYSEDGKLKLVGMLTSAPLGNYYNETRGQAISIDRVFEIIYEETGIRLEGQP